MGKHSKIEWTTHTFNPWWGCVKVSQACKHCYADAWAKRVGQKLWGPKAPRRFFSDAHWREPVRWNAEAERTGERPRVFCASMADVFEDRRDLDEHRARLWNLIEATPHLDWLLLTKRPQNVVALTRWGDAWPQNVWLGATIENQKVADERLDDLASVPARVRFVSAEPLLSALDLTPWLGSKVHWVITGGESGGKARPANPSWFRGIRDQCRDAGAAFHFKQWGEWTPAPAPPKKNGRAVQCRIVADGVIMARLGKKAAGRKLDGRTWDELPTTKKTKRSRSSKGSPKAVAPSPKSSASKPQSGLKARRA